MGTIYGVSTAPTGTATIQAGVNGGPGGGSSGTGGTGGNAASTTLIDVVDGEVTAEIQRTEFEAITVANAISARGLVGDVYPAPTVRTRKLVR